MDHISYAHQSAQPVPFPLNPPLNVQVIFSTRNKAMIAWDAPMKLNQRGCHAWQEWTYELSIKTHLAVIFPKEEPFEISIKNISNTSFLYTRIFTNLESKSDLFEFAVKATSPSGESENSSPVVASNLKQYETLMDPKIVWTTEDFSVHNRNQTNVLRMFVRIFIQHLICHHVTTKVNCVQKIIICKKAQKLSILVNMGAFILRKHSRNHI